MILFGRVSLTDAERLNNEPLALQLERVEHFANQMQLDEWLHRQTDASVAAFEDHREVYQWVIGKAIRARWTFAGRAKVFLTTRRSKCSPPPSNEAKYITKETWPSPGRDALVRPFPGRWRIGFAQQCQRHFSGHT
jgi:hypothetical protein